MGTYCFNCKKDTMNKKTLWLEELSMTDYWLNLTGLLLQEKPIFTRNQEAGEFLCKLGTETPINKTSLVENIKYENILRMLLKDTWEGCVYLVLENLVLSLTEI